MRKPPTTLIVAQMTATKPRIVADVAVLRARGDERADERDAADGVGRRHQRRVQQRRHARDDHEADEAGEYEDVELENESLRQHHDGGLRRLRRRRTTLPATISSATSMLQRAVLA